MSRPVGTYDLFLVPAGNLTTPLTDLIIPAHLGRVGLCREAATQNSPRF